MGEEGQSSLILDPTLKHPCSFYFMKSALISCWAISSFLSIFTICIVLYSWTSSYKIKQKWFIDKPITLNCLLFNCAPSHFLFLLLLSSILSGCENSRKNFLTYLPIELIANSSQHLNQEKNHLDTIMR